jgi:hypothetical protein
MATAAPGCSSQSTSPTKSYDEPAKKSNGSAWDIDVTSLPKWTPKESALKELEDEVVFGGYAIRPPNGYMLSSHSDKLGPDVKLGTYGWSREGLTPAMWLDLTFRPEAEWKEGADVRIKGDLARVKTLSGGEARADVAQFGNVGGMVTVRAAFDATSKKGEKERKYKGYQCIARSGGTSIDILVIVSDSDDETTLEILEASMLTLRKR